MIKVIRIEGLDKYIKKNTSTTTSTKKTTKSTKK